MLAASSTQAVFSSLAKFPAYNTCIRFGRFHRGGSGGGATREISPVASAVGQRREERVFAAYSRASFTTRLKLSLLNARLRARLDYKEGNESYAQAMQGDPRRNYGEKLHEKANTSIHCLGGACVCVSWAAADPPDKAYFHNNENSGSYRSDLCPASSFAWTQKKRKKSRSAHRRKPVYRVHFALRLPARRRSSRRLGGGKSCVAPLSCLLSPTDDVVAICATATAKPRCDLDCRRQRPPPLHQERFLSLCAQGGLLACLKKKKEKERACLQGIKTQKTGMMPQRRRKVTKTLLAPEGVNELPMPACLQVRLAFLATAP